ncbi:MULTISPECIES: hypothetical protein [unclassified Novosphingobium]|uniref:hypothetical protein n=1 Tax=unclassified Novosphingobium TaxID=2644732 RepID=UPI0003B474E8|nr:MULTISPECIES: hypothetical protein [unclassified Novosphingobium]MBB3356811.1 hypothetical protein [Novosphingobium sp. BK256]MBB3373212.1 hypothetical protein [Novosphingobium sp. BK280]MBB3377581.1 hypothetical protein [Novosphingobium sp. BK258]MBB3419008.1 hypothetical protein [Novosphingobium sp. BK267]MBB3450157.1 hypothetical protein [Novosphingobium sp. BK352]
MALTNAERQRRYRQKLKARASGEAAGDLVRAMVDRAVAVLWRVRAAAAPEDALIVPAGSPADLPTTPPSLDAFRATLARHPASLLALCRTTLQRSQALGLEERALLCSLLEIEAALRLSRPRQP